MSNTIGNDRIVNNDDEHVSPDAVQGAHDADGTMGRVAGTGSGAISGGIVGAAVGGPIGAAIGAVGGALLGAAGGNAAHKVGDDHDDVNVETGSGGDLGKNAGAGAGSISGAIVGGAAGGPLGAVAGAVGGGMLGAAAGDGAKDMGGADDSTSSRTGVDVTPGNNIPGVQTGGVTTAGADTRGLSEKTADAITGDRYDDKTGGVVTGGPLTGVGTTGMRSDASALSSDADVMRVPVVEEELHVDKDRHQAGEVQVSKHVVSEEVNVPVTLQREEVVVRRNPVDRDLAPGETVDTLQDGDTIRVPVMEETVNITKTARVKEEIEIEKQRTSETQTVRDTVRHEEVDINDTTGSRLTGGSIGNAVPGVQTGGVTTAGSDTRGVTEKAADAVTGDRTDDKTGGRVL